MRIQGLQKLTLLDFPGKVACTVFTPGCDLRCPFCHNAPLVLGSGEGPDIPEEEVMALLKKRRGMLEGVCITGGEPLLQRGLEAFMRAVKELGYAVKLDTNGTRFDRLKKILEEGLVDYVAMDIKNAPDRYGETAGVPGMDTQPIMASARLLMEGKVPFEFRTTVVREFHGPQEMRQIGTWLAGEEPYFLQNFVDSGDLVGKDVHGCTHAEMAALLGILKEKIPHAQLRGRLKHILYTKEK